jgi:hypothetical protein
MMPLPVGRLGRKTSKRSRGYPSLGSPPSRLEGPPFRRPVITSGQDSAVQGWAGGSPPPGLLTTPPDLGFGATRGGATDLVVRGGVFPAVEGARTTGALDGALDGALMIEPPDDCPETRPLGVLLTGARPNVPPVGDLVVGTVLGAEEGIRAEGVLAEGTFLVPVDGARAEGVLADGAFL